MFVQFLPRGYLKQRSIVCETDLIGRISVTGTNYTDSCWRNVCGPARLVCFSYACGHVRAGAG